MRIPKQSPRVRPSASPAPAANAAKAAKAAPADAFEPKAGGDSQGQLINATKPMQKSKSAQEDVKAIMAGVKS